MIGWFKRQALLKHHKTCKNHMQIKYPKLVNVNKKPALKIYAITIHTNQDELSEGKSF